jgi:DNA-binding NarL/FixJ family response regulator
LETSSVRVLVVEDSIPFRRFVCSTLSKRTELQIVGESSDGLEAVHKVEELHPHLVVLDIGLPTLNGIEVARRVRQVAPQSKIIFVSQESSADVVHEALALGALGYVVKSQAGSELLVAVQSVLEGRRFISSGLSAPHEDDPSPSLMSSRSEISRSHEVEFYSDDAAFVVGFARFIEAALEAGNAVIAVTTESHQKSLLQRLQEYGVDTVAAIEQGRYVPLDVAETLTTFMVNDLPDPVRFLAVIADLVAPAARATSERRVAICGECGSSLWVQGKADAAIQVEQLCKQVAKRYGMDILCGFSLSSFYREEDREIFQKICRRN